MIRAYHVGVFHRIREREKAFGASRMISKRTGNLFCVTRSAATYAIATARFTSHGDFHVQTHHYLQVSRRRQGR